MPKYKNTILSAAFSTVVQQGFSIMPVGSDKRPLLASWKEYQNRIATEDEIIAWWAKHPKANIGVITGAISGITVVDIDTYAGADESPFPETYTVRTGNGGLQLYYKYCPGFTVSANAYPQFPHVDLRSDGGYVVAPPSVIIPKSEAGKLRGGKYVVEKDLPFAPFPKHLFMTSRGTSPLKKPRKPLASMFGMKDGDGRNNALASFIGGMLHSTNESSWDKTILPAVIAMNQTFTPPLDEDELMTTYNSITRTEKKKRDDEASGLIASPVDITDDQKQALRNKRLGISVNQYGIPHHHFDNLVNILERDENFAGRFRYDVFRREIQIRLGNETDFHPYDDGALLVILSKLQGFFTKSANKGDVHDAITHVANLHQFDEPTEWLESLKWDKTPRLETWLSQGVGVEDDEDGYHRAIGARWLAGLVSRLTRPGIIFDYTLVLVGGQGIGKTSVFRILGGKWYREFTGSVDDKDFYMRMRGTAILDLDEGASLSRTDSIKIKSILTQTEDTYRAPYDRVVKTYPRRFVFSMTTNDTEHLRDMTGNRRFWSVKVPGMVNFKWLEENRDQLFAEAYHVVKNNLALPEMPWAVVERMQEEHTERDPWADEIMHILLSSPLFRSASDEYNIASTDLFKELSGDSLGRMRRAESMRVGQILRSKEFGMERVKRRIDGEARWVYVLSEKKKQSLKETPPPEPTTIF